MSRKKMHKKTVLPLPAKIAIAALLALCLLFVTLCSVTLAVIRSLDAGAREKLCGTMAEKGLFCADWFFTSDEIARATAYTAPDGTEEAPAAAAPMAEALSESDYYAAAVYEISSDAIALGAYRDSSDGDRLCIGLAAYPGMVFTDGTLFHTGEADYQRFCFCGMTADGVLHIGQQSPVEAVNSGYLWGIACARVLVADGIPAADLRGGYGMRAAVGQRADGTLFLLIASEKTDRLYPRGITYDGLAHLCAQAGAVRAAALPLAGKAFAGGEPLGKASGDAGYTLSAVIRAN